MDIDIEKNDTPFEILFSVLSVLLMAKLTKKQLANNYFTILSQQTGKYYSPDVIESNSKRLRVADLVRECEKIGAPINHVLHLELTDEAKIDFKERREAKKIKQRRYDIETILKFNDKYLIQWKSDIEKSKETKEEFHKILKNV